MSALKRLIELVDCRLLGVIEMKIVRWIVQRIRHFFSHSVCGVLRHMGVMKEREASPEEIEELYEFIENYGREDKEE